MPLIFDTASVHAPREEPPARVLAYAVAQSLVDAWQKEQTLLAAYSAALDAHPDVRQIAADLAEAQRHTVTLTEAAKNAAKAAKTGVALPGLQIVYSYPTRKVVDAQLLVELLPAAREIPGLLRLEVSDVKVFEAAVAAGVVPAGVAEQVTRLEPTTRGGRAEVRFG